MYKKISFIIIISFMFLTVGLANVKAKKTGKDGLKHSPKNIIILISDGCGYNQIDAASMYQYGQTGVQVYEDFPVSLGVSTFAAGGGYDPMMTWENFDHVKRGATDSAAAATAMSCGVKTYSGAIGVSVDKQPMGNLIEKCEQLGKATGVVSSVQFSHATPAGFVAHNVSRNNYAEIANEMIYKSKCDVIMGCGAPDYDNSGKPASMTRKFVGGGDTWADISDDAMVIGADADGDNVNDVWTVVRTKAEFQSLATGDVPSRVLGVPMVHKTLQQSRGGDGKAEPFETAMNENVPTLGEMAAAALNVLDNDEDGLFLMVEGGAVDWAGHANQSGRVIEEEIEFNKSVEAVIEWVEAKSNWGETLVIVTGDHETGYMTGLDSGNTADGAVWNELTNNGAGAQPGMEWHSGSHTNQVIPFFAKGRGAKLFKDAVVGVDPVKGDYIDNSSVANVIFDLLK